MLDSVDDKLAEWVKTVLGETEVLFTPPGEKETNENVVFVYLLDVAPDPGGRGAKSSSIQLLLRYLIVPRGTTEKESHAALGKLLIAALENNSEAEVDKNPPPLEIWRAFGIIPRPHFVLRVPFRYEREKKGAPPVRFPLIVRQSVMTSLSGQILDAESFPVAGALVALPAYELSTTTDAAGRFHLAAVPSEPPDKNLLVRAAGRDFQISTAQIRRENETLIIQLKSD